MRHLLGCTSESGANREMICPSEVDVTTAYSPGNCPVLIVLHLSQLCICSSIVGVRLGGECSKAGHQPLNSFQRVPRPLVDNCIPRAPSDPTFPAIGCASIVWRDQRRDTRPSSPVPVLCPRRPSTVQPHPTRTQARLDVNPP